MANWRHAGCYRRRPGRLTPRLIPSFMSSRHDRVKRLTILRPLMDEILPPGINIWLNSWFNSSLLEEEGRSHCAAFVGRYTMYTIHTECFFLVPQNHFSVYAISCIFYIPKKMSGVDRETLRGFCLRGLQRVLQADGNQIIIFHSNAVKELSTKVSRRCGTSWTPPTPASPATSVRSPGS